MRRSDAPGNSVATAGDVNGDGFSDILISAGDFDRLGANDVGALYVLFG